MDLELDLAEAAAAAPGPAEESPRPVPWEDPAVGRLPAFFRTLGSLLFYPTEFFQNLGGEGQAEPFAFGLIAGTGGSMAALFWLVLLGMAASHTAALTSGLPQTFDAGTGMALGAMVLAPALVVANLATGSLCLWAAVAVVGENRGFTPAWRLYCYLQGVAVLGLIPFFGAPLAKIWALFLIFLAARTHLALSPGKALATLLIFLVLEILLWTLLLGSLLTLGALLGFFLFLAGS